MTQKDYIALAAALKAQMPVWVEGYNKTAAGEQERKYHAVAYHQWCHDVIAVMNVCADDNANFHRGKFLKALGVANIGVK